MRVGAQRAGAPWESSALCHDRLRRLALFNPFLESRERVELVGGRPAAAVRHTGNEKRRAKEAVFSAPPLSLSSWR